MAAPWVLCLAATPDQLGTWPMLGQCHADLTSARTVVCGGLLYDLDKLGAALTEQARHAGIHSGNLTVYVVVADGSNENPNNPLVPPPFPEPGPLGLEPPPDRVLPLPFSPPEVDR